MHRKVSGLESIGIDEIQYRRRHKYLTLVYQLNEGAKRLLYVAKDRTEASLHGFFDTLDASTISGIKFACTNANAATKATTTKATKKNAGGREASRQEIETSG